MAGDASSGWRSSSDILVENYRPGRDGWLRPGLSDALAASNPRLIYASISGYGQTGPDRAKGGFDLIAQGVSGIMSITGEPGRPPVKAGIPLTDLGAGLFAVTGILAALHHRASSGVGQQIDTSLVEAGVALSVWEATEYFAGSWRTGAAGVGSPDERAVSGHSVRGRLRHDRREHRSAVSAALRRARSSGVGGRRLSSRTTAAACATVQARRPDRERHGP